MFRKVWAATAALAAVALLVVGCAQSTPAEDQPRSLTVASVAPPGSFDPLDAQGATTYLFYQPVYDTLVRAEPDGTLVPMLGTSWEYDSSLTTLTMKLRTDVKFSDGTPFNAEAVKANVMRYRDSSATDAATLAALTGVTVVDASTVSFKLSAPDPAFLVYLSTAAAFQASPASFDDPNLKTKPVGTGPYLLDSEKTVVGSSYVYNRNPDYWDPSLMPWETVTIVVLADETARVNALRTGQVDFTVISNTADVAPLEQAGYQLTRHSVNWFGLNIFDRTGSIVPALADVRVRQAINYAIDVKSILSALGRGDGSPTSQIFPSTSVAYDASLDNAWPYDPAKAKQLLAQAGYANGFSMNMASTSGLIDPAFFANVKQLLSEVGITVNLTELPLPDYVGALLKGTYPMAVFLFGQSSDWEVLNQYVTPKARWNVLHTTDQKVTDLVHTVQYQDGDARTKALRDINKYVVDQAWFGPWYRPDLFYFTSNDTVVTPQAGRASPYIYNFAPKK